MVETKQDFITRLNNVDERRTDLVRRGYTLRVARNGIIVAQPNKTRLRLPVKGAFLMVLSFFVFKAFILSANGPDAYQDRLAILQNGTAIEALGGRLLAIDPVTEFLANKMGPLFR